MGTVFYSGVKENLVFSLIRMPHLDPGANSKNPAAKKSPQTS
jgi:hypothetical protein